MKVLHLNEHLSWSGGVETYLLSLVPKLEALGHQQVVCCAKGNDPSISNVRHAPWLARADAASRLLAAREMANILQEEQPDVVHVHNIHNTGALGACLRAAPTILHGHDFRYLCPASSFYLKAREAICERTCGPACFAVTVRGRCMSLRPPYAWTYYQRVRYVARRANDFALAIGNSRYTGDRFVKAGFSPDRVTILPYFCPIEPINRRPAPPARPTILFIGRARENKGYRYFVEALGKLPQAVRGIMVGDFSGNLEAGVRRLGQRCGCGDRLELRPWAGRDAIQTVYAEASVTVVPSVWAEPMGIVGLESLACGVPVVASDVGGVREWLIEGQTGRLVPAKDGAAIAGAVAEILDSSDQGAELGWRGCELIREKFSPAKHIEALLDAYQLSQLNQPAGSAKSASLAHS